MSDFTVLAIDVLVRIAFFFDSLTLRDVFAWFVVLTYAALLCAVACVVIGARMEAREDR